MNTLIVDDEKMILSIITRRVGNVLPDAELHPFNKSSEAIEYANSSFAELAFIDINMPEIDGFTLAKQLKKAAPGINIVFCTGYSEYADEAIKIGDGYITKPVTEDKIKKALEQVNISASA